MRPLQEIAAWTLLALLAAGTVFFYKPIPLTNDSIVYLNVAESLRTGQGPSTTIIHYDTERSHARIPAPMTTFPPGYPAVIALLGPSQAGARLVSLLSFVAIIALLAWGLLLSGVPVSIRATALLLLLTNATVLRFASAINSESLFMFFTTASLLCLCWSEHSERRAPLTLACLAIGLAYTVRYAALFLIPVVVAYALYRAWNKGWRNALPALIPIAIATGFTLRNALLVGDWRGGNDMVITHPIGPLIAEYARGEIHLLLGNHRLKPGFSEALLALSAVVVAVHFRFKRGLVAAWIVTYTAAFFYAARNSVVALDSRMFVPMMPCYVLLLVYLRHSKVLTAALVTFTIAYAAINLKDRHETDPRPRPEVLAEFIGPSMGSWIQANIGANEVITAPDGQATAHLLRRPVLSLTPALYSPIRWECSEILKQMGRFSSRYLIVYKPAGYDEFLFNESQFLAASAEVQQACGFTIGIENAAVRILVRH